ncbi:hypothetical protein ILUMI_07008 [Ignelater luminosus]|uniref:Uncharacterized protein n=1 Tax=Ignelater luminosus TaxID=2038154 RepID=A0A8K0D4A7_IGNLU|nr:hypothetical protein ILUMI_07008 [Ignelater luminosus]
MKLGTSKSKTIVASRQEVTHRIKACGQGLKQVEAFKYLGVNVASDEEINHEINSLTEAAGRMFYSVNTKFLRKREVSEKTEMSVYRLPFEDVER